MTAGFSDGSDFTDIEFAALEREFRLLARELTPADRQRLALPQTLWPRIDMGTRDTGGNDPSVSGRLARPRQLGREALALAAGLLILLFGAVALVNLGDRDAQVLAEASLGNDGLSVEFDGDGAVEFRSTPRTNEIEVRLSSLPKPSDGSFYELWMIDPTTDGMVSLGPITLADDEAGGSYVVTVPGSIEFESFPVVDLSIEPTDGDPTHSGQSILRGTLNPTAET